MSYLSLALLGISRVLVRRNRTVSVLNIILTLIILAVWAAIIWFIRAEYNGALVLQLTVLVQVLSVSALVIFSSSAIWQKYFSRQTIAWLEAMPALVFGSIISIVTLVPYYLAYTSLSSNPYILLRLVSITLLCISWGVIAASIGLFIQKTTASVLARALLYIAACAGVFYLVSSEIFTVINTGLQANTINTAITATLLTVGLCGFSIALLEVVSSIPDRFHRAYRYSGLLTSFRIFGISGDQRSVQITNAVLHWLRSTSNQYRLAALLLVLYGINKIYQATELIDQRGSILLFGAVICAFTATISFTATTRSQLQRYHWLPLTKNSAATSDWLAGVLIYALTLAVFYWFSTNISLSVFGTIAAVALITHTITVGVVYNLSRVHQHFTDRLTPLIIGSALLGLTPGLFFQIVPTDITYAVLGLWLLSTLVFFRFVNRENQLSVR